MAGLNMQFLKGAPRERRGRSSVAIDYAKKRPGLGVQMSALETEYSVHISKSETIMLSRYRPRRLINISIVYHHSSEVKRMVFYSEVAK